MKYYYNQPKPFDYQKFTKGVLSAIVFVALTMGTWRVIHAMNNFSVDTEDNVLFSRGQDIEVNGVSSDETGSAILASTDGTDESYSDDDAPTTSAPEYMQQALPAVQTSNVSDQVSIAEASVAAAPTPTPTLPPVPSSSTSPIPPTQSENEEPTSARFIDIEVSVLGLNIELSI